MSQALRATEGLSQWRRSTRMHGSNRSGSRADVRETDTTTSEAKDENEVLREVTDDTASGILARCAFRTIALTSWCIAIAAANVSAIDYRPVIAISCVASAFYLTLYLVQTDRSWILETGAGLVVLQFADTVFRVRFMLCEANGGAMTAMMRLALPIPFFIFFAAVTCGNFMLLAEQRRRPRGPSLVTLIGGTLGAVGTYILLGGATLWMLVPLTLDPGSIPILVAALFARWRARGTNVPCTTLLSFRCDTELADALVEDVFLRRSEVLSEPLGDLGELLTVHGGRRALHFEAFGQEGQVLIVEVGVLRYDEYDFLVSFEEKLSFGDRISRMLGKRAWVPLTAQLHEVHERVVRFRECSDVKWYCKADFAEDHGKTWHPRPV